MVTTTIEKFELHPSVAYSLTMNQAESLAKAITEAIMNSKDAGSTQVTIAVNEKDVTITDNGRGFHNQAEIDEFFSKIGTPHKEGDAQFGRFRLGRCQLFAYGLNTWRSNRFKMIVDIKNRGLEHDVYANEPQHDHCTIKLDLYQPLDTPDINALIHTLKKTARWIDMSVTINDIQITEPLTSITWTVETEDGYYLINKSPYLRIYNMGVLLREIPVYETGFGGEIVTKIAIKTNAARNDILDTSAEWHAILETARKHQPTKRGRNSKEEYPRIYTAAQQAAHAQNIITGRFTVLYAIEGNLQLFTSPLQQLLKFRRFTAPDSGVLVDIETNSPEAQMLEKSKIAQPIMVDSLEPFGYHDCRTMMDTLIELAEDENQTKPSPTLKKAITQMKAVSIKTIKDFEHVFKNNYNDLPERAITRTNRDSLIGLTAMSEWYASEFSLPVRTIKIGTSATKTTWTDTKSIWYSQSFLENPFTTRRILSYTIAMIMNYKATQDNRGNIEPSTDDANDIEANLLDNGIAGDLTQIYIDSITRLYHDTNRDPSAIFARTEKYAALCQKIKRMSHSGQEANQ